MASETLVRVENIHKKFCRSLKRSLWYGIRDMGAELRGSSRKNITLRKDEFWALADVSFEIKKSELVGLIGANGAGKTTMLKLLSGLIKPDRGVITIRGKIQALIALGAGFNPILTGRENIYINGAILGFAKKEIDSLLEEIMDFSEIGEFIDMPVQSYSSGMQVRLGFAVAVNLKPDILIVDEVLAVGDASFRRKARKKMMELLHSGISVLFVSHNMALVSSMTSRCIYLDKGRVAAIGPSADVTARYLGDSFRKSSENRGDEEQEDFLMTSAYLTVPDVFLLKTFHIRNRSGEANSEFNTYYDIRLGFEIGFLKPVEKVLLAFNIRDQVDDMVISSGKMRLDDRPCAGTMTVECDIKNNKLREGTYHIGFYVSDDDGGSLYKSHSVGVFTILADMSIIEKADSTQGFMVIDTAWRVL